MPRGRGGLPAAGAPPGPGRRHPPIGKGRAAGAILLAGLALAGCARHLGTDPLPGEPDLPRSGFEVLRDQRYTPPDWPEPLTLDVYRPQAEGPSPAVLVVHGGGWTRRSPEDMAGICRYLARRGFVAFNLAYRFAPEYRFPAQLEDLRQALAWVRANAGRFDVDPERIGGFGYSAGAHLVSLLAVSGQPGEAGDGARLAAVVAGGTPTDLRAWPDSPLVNTLIGRPRDEAPETWRAASPIAHVSSDDPPFFLYHGGLDQLVEPEQAERMYQALDQAGIHAELYLVPWHGHVSMFVLGRSALERGTDFLGRMLAL